MKAVVLDIEMAPAIVYSWGMHNQNHSIDQIIQAPYMLCFAARWVGSEETLFFRGEGMLQACHDILTEADAVIHYNGQSFDMKHINREFWLADMEPPAPYAQIDLYRTVKKQFLFISNKLDHILRMKELGGKVKHEGFSLWPKVMAGDEEAWVQFQHYCETDVDMTHELYQSIRPWVVGHPNVLLYDENPEIKGCPTCGSGNYQSRGVRQLATGIYQRYVCLDCKTWFRAVKRENGSTVR